MSHKIPDYLKPDYQGELPEHLEEMCRIFLHHLEVKRQKNREGKAESDLSALLTDLYGFMEEYIDEYEVRGDNGDYTPTEQERWLMHDCLMGLLDEPEFVEKWQRWRNAGGTLRMSCGE